MKRILRPLTGAIIAAAMGTASAGIVTFQDDNLDFHLRVVDGVLVPVEADTRPTNDPDYVGSQLLPGDVLLAVLEYNTAGGEAIGPNRELTGVAVIQASIDNGGFVFSPYEGGLNAAVNAFGSVDINVTGGEAGGGAMLALWLDGTPDLNIDAGLVTEASGFTCNNLGECIDQATDGTVFQVDGFVDGDNNYWEAFGAPLLADPSAVLQQPVADIEGFFNAGLSILDPGISGADGVQLDGNLGPVDALLNGTVNGGGYSQWVNTAQRDSLVASGFVATTDTDLQKSIPVPAPLALFGLGLLGFAFSKRRLT